MDGMEILHVFPTFSVGGVQIRIADVANRLGEGFVHRCITLDGRTDAAARLAPQTDWRFEEGSAPRGLRGLGAIRRRLAAHAPDLLCTYNWGAMDWALAASAGSMPHLHFESGFGPEEAKRTLRRRNLYRRLALRRTKRLIVPSTVLERLARTHRWIAPKHIVLLPNGVDLDYYAAVHGEGGAAPTVASVAPLRREKRLDRLIALFAAVAKGIPARLALCGAGPCEADLRRQALASGRGGDITFHGQLADVRPVLDSAAVFAMTSETEQMPNALLQAMAMGCPVVAFDAGDIAAILPPEQRAFVVAQGDGDGFQTALCRLLSDRDLRAHLGTLNRARVETDYSMTRMVGRYRALYREAAA